jgi:response regulator RpfG family c-di-GMP phosphodiesterase
MPTPFGKPASDHEKSEYRLLYVGQDAEWYRRLRSVLGLPANRLVYCPEGIGVEHFLKSDIRYDLFLFDLDLLNETGLELVRLVRSLPHRQHTPIIIVAAHEVINSLGELTRSAGANECLTKTEDMKAAVETIQRMLCGRNG